MMARGRTPNELNRSRAATQNALRKSNTTVKGRRNIPWLAVAGAVVVLVLAGSIFGVVYSKQHAKDQAVSADAPWTPSPTNMDPARKITPTTGLYIGQEVENNGVLVFPKYKAALHVSATQRVAYDRFPPVGGPHDGTWAACNGVVYAKAVRDENMVHTLEHGAIWIAYNPAKVSQSDISTLKNLVVGQQYISMSPYPTLDQPISLQSWGHQLKVQTATDPRIHEFIVALRLNPYTYPEIGASCDQDPSVFDPNNPPPFDPSPRDSSAVPLDGAGLTAASETVAGQTSPPSGATSGAASSGAASGPSTGTSAGSTPAATTTASK